ncbi:ABC transporter ATP-binding protein [Cellulomonas denverensis]|uniref:ATP-binding cassette domain-containing protein n=1 Tax=Cellulomonas denverensis TaxID=264297 RepID=A0A7X6KVU4_9CELL|nr:ATP-binding cassette domain-containing protein [Cellulomonas denverensis]NKY23073.1 ATP-binding cassette domain-containing protein [Cellulomonas denverensis]GIG23846.1 peptide ABC transporter ATP-binding protein [Cellulomonas denverensis]
MTGTPLVAQQVWAGYGGAPVLTGVDLTLAPGDTIGLIGSSGAGKSTLIRVLLGLNKPTQGRATYGGRTVSRLSRKEKKHFRTTVRAVHQEGLSGADPRTSVERLLLNTLNDARKAGLATGQQPADVLATVGMEPRFLARTLQSLSGGERQRVVLANALATRPEILILDEPATALDPALRDTVTDRIAELTAAGVGLLVVSHDLRMVDRLTSVTHVLAEGRIVESGPVRRLMTEPQHEETRALAEALPEAIGGLR